MVGVASVDGLQRAERLRIVLVGAVCVLGGVAAGVMAGSMAHSTHVVAVAALGGLAIPLILWRWPESGVVIFILGATLVEQFPVGVGSGVGTDHIPFFTSLSDGVGLKGVLFTPSELLIVLVFLIWLMRAILRRELTLPRTPVTLGLGLLMAVAIFAEIRGMGAGGDLRVSLRELRPWIYLVLLYLFASQTVRTERAVHAMWWAMVLGSGFKAFQGLWRYIALRHVYPRPESYLGHEESVFFGMVILLTLCLWIFGTKSRLRTVATVLAPFVLAADIINGRRIAWLILAAGVVGIMAVAWVRLPQRRPAFRKGLLGLGVALAIYLPAFWNVNNALALPARTVRSIVAPDPRDQSSDLYRVQEDNNLKNDILHNTPLGDGFGRALTYALPIVDISNIDPFIKYIPHDGVLYVWVRMGMAGALAFWWLIGAAVVTACQLARAPNRLAGLYGTFALCGILAYVLMGKYDMGFFWFRIAFYMGCVLGALDGVRSTVPQEVLASLSRPLPRQRAGQEPGQSRTRRRPGYRPAHGSPAPSGVWMRTRSEWISSEH